MLRKSAFSLLLVILCWNSWAQRPPYVDPLLMIELVEKIKQHCPPQDCLYVGIGRSPTLLTTAMRLQDEMQVIDLPLSNFRYVARPEHELPRQTVMLHRNQREILFAHFDNYFSKELLRKRVLLMDFSISGASIASTYNFLEIYFSDHRKMATPPDLSAFLMVGAEEDARYISSSLMSRGVKDKYVLPLKNSGFDHIHNLLYAEKFDLYSRGGTFKIEDYPSVADYRKNWVIDSNLDLNRQLHRSILDSIAEDPELERRYPISCSAHYY